MKKLKLSRGNFTKKMYAGEPVYVDYDNQYDDYYDEQIKCGKMRQNPFTGQLENAWK